jgi:predicted RNA-binding Zn-ribbon protein involved in translation (DUF1610 family)
VKTEHTSTSLSPDPVLRRCASCGTVMSELVSTMMLRESAATRAMSSSHECVVCRLAQYRRAVRDQCPRCQSVRVLRTEHINDHGDEMYFCPHCDHIWSSS